MHDVTRREVLPGGFIRALRKFPDQLLKDDPHAEVADGCRAQVNAGKPLHHLVEQVVGAELLYEVFKMEMLENLPGILAERLNITHQVISRLAVRQSSQA